MIKSKKIVTIDNDKNKIIELMQRAATGDYTKATNSDFADPELKNAFNNLISSVEENNNYIVMRLNNSMSTIGDSSCVKNMIEQVNEQTLAITDLRGTSKDLGDSITNIQDSILKIQNNTGSVTDFSEKCINDIGNSVDIVDNATSKVLDISGQITDFKEKATKIAEIIDIVKKIASKSGLLALNASIEAARAGESGRGFAVVAGQVKELSSNTTQSAERIVKYVSELTDGIDSLYTAILETADELKRGNQSIHDSVEYLHEMDSEIDSIKGSVDSISSEIGTQMALTENFLTAIDSLADNYDSLSEGCMTTGGHLYTISRDVDKTRSDLARKGANLSLTDWLTIYEIDHLIFTWRVYNHLAGFEKLQLSQVNNPHGCKFGKWAATVHDARVTGNSNFNATVRNHERIHKYAVDSFNAMENNDRAKALAAFNQAYNAYLDFKKTITDLRNSLK